MMKTDELTARAKEATVRFLERKNYAILDRNPEGFAAVAKDADAVVVRRGEGARLGRAGLRRPPARQEGL